MVQKKDLQIEDLITIGFKPLIFFQHWRVATLCYLEELYPTAIHSLERHMETDEVFILMQGQATLMLGGSGETVDRVEALPMQSLKAYDVRLGSWHGVIMSRDAVILLVENADTGRENSEYFELAPGMRQSYLREAVKFPDWRNINQLK